MPTKGFCTKGGLRRHQRLLEAAQVSPERGSATTRMVTLGRNARILCVGKFAERQPEIPSMKTKLFLLGNVISAALVLSGCKEEQSAPETAAPKTSENVPSPPIAQTVSQAVAIIETQTNVAPQVTNVPAPQAQVAIPQAQPAEGQAQSIIARAKSLYDEKKYQDALGSLAGLANVQLTPEQQKLVDNLKTQLQAALAKNTAADAGSALGGVLGEKK
jgi:hypothetical protein